MLVDIKSYFEPNRMMTSGNVSVNNDFCYKVLKLHIFTSLLIIS